MTFQIPEFYTFKSFYKKHLSKIQDISFLILLSGIFFFLGFEHILFFRPKGMHFMRQTDSISFVSNYYNNGFNFFNPELFNLKSIDGRAACEFPIVYYITALSYIIFGEKEFLLRLIHLVIISIGLFCIYKASYLLLKDYLYSLFVALFLFTSTVFCYYSSNFLPDPSALGFVFIGWYFFLLYKKNERKSTLLTSFIFFTLAGLIKITYLINPLTIIVLNIVELYLSKNQVEISNKQAKKILTFGVLCLLVVIAWNIYVIYYNHIYKSHSFITEPLPIWDLRTTEIIETWKLMCNNYWYPKYFAFSSFHLLYLMIVFQIVFFKKSHPRLSLTTLILFLGSLAYFILFYSQFKDHDYYFMAFFPLSIFFLINAISIYKALFLKPYFQILLKLLLFIIVISGANFARLKLTERYENKQDSYSQIGILLKDISSELENLKIPKNAKFLITPDRTPNGGLYFLNRKGWSIENYEEISADTIKSYQQKGAEYFLLSVDNLKLLSTAGETGKLIYKKEGVAIFKLSAKY